MSERGTFAMDRGWFDHPSFADEPYTERESWAWLIAEAAYRPHCRRVGSFKVTLARGQVAHSLRFMAEKWGWAEPRVRRFLQRLRADAMIDAANDAGVTVITIRNYSKYQNAAAIDDAASDAANDAGSTQDRRKEESIDKGGGRGGDAPARETSGQPTASDHEIARAFLTAIKRDADDVGWFGAVAYQAAVWRSRGYAVETILADAAEIETKGEKPPSYFFKAIERRHVERAREASQPATFEVSHAQANRPARGGGSLAALARRRAREAAEAAGGT